MEVQVLNKFSDMNLIEVLKSIVTVGGGLEYLAIALIFPSVIMFLYVAAKLTTRESETHKNKPKSFMWLMSMWIVLVIISSIVCVLFIKHNYVGVGNYKADTKPHNIKQAERINGSYKYTFEVKDENKSRIKLEYQGHKFNKNDEIRVETKKQLLKGSDSKQKSFNLNHEDNYIYRYKGHKLKTDGIRPFSIGALRGS